MLRVLIVEDDRDFATYLTNEVLPALGCALDVRHVTTIADARKALAETDVDLLVLDVMLPRDATAEEEGRIDDLGGVKVLGARDASTHPPATIVLSSADKETAVRLVLENRIDDYLFKEIPLDECRARFRSLLRSLHARRRTDVLERGLSYHGTYRRILGSSSALRQALRLADKVAPLDTTVLIDGETGTGKELFAAYLHLQSGRAEKPFVPVNCSALPETLLESELFGHVKGAFSGAIRDRVGVFEMAEGGTLFLDEVGELSTATQVRLLRTIEERVIERVGDNRPIDCDFRLVSATNRDLKADVACGSFRDDLFHRLGVFTITLPPLRMRTGDVPLFVDAFITEFNEVLGKDITGLTPEALDVVTAYDWPGNVRELRNVLERGCILTDGSKITIGALPPHLGGAPTSAPLRYQEGMDRAEREILQAALARADNNVKEAATLLGLPLRTAYRKLAAQGLLKRGKVV